MRYLIDGYNLLFTLGTANRYSGPKALLKARADLLAWLQEAHGSKANDVLVIFDGRNVPTDDAEAGGARADPVGTPTATGIRVRFSAGQSADDLIEELIRRAPDPEKLTVVSSDHRLQAAAKRRRCPTWDCTDYIDWALDRGQPLPKPAPPPAKPDAPTAEETEQWLQEFGPLTDDPELEKFNRPFEDFQEPH